MGVRDLPFDLQVLVNLPRALWDVPTPQLRFIALRFHDTGLAARFGYDVPIDDDIRELVALAETYLIADFHPTPEIVFLPEFVPADERPALLDGEEWYYRRHEPPSDG